MTQPAMMPAMTTRESFRRFISRPAEVPDRKAHGDHDPHRQNGKVEAERRKVLDVTAV